MYLEEYIYELKYVLLDHYTQKYLFFIVLAIYVWIASFHIKEKLTRKDIFMHFLLFFYIFSVISISFFPFRPSYQLDYFPEMLTLRYNLIPFDIFQNQISWRPDKHIILFIPTWFIFPFLLRWKYSWKKIIFFWLCVSFWVEILQFLYSFISSNLWYYPPKVFNVDDIIMNTIWVFIWFIAYSIYENLSKIYKK